MSNNSSPTGYVRWLSKQLRQTKSDRTLLGVHTDKHIEELEVDLGQARRRLKDRHEGFADLGEQLNDLIDSQEDSIFSNIYRPLVDQLVRTGRKKAEAVGEVPEAEIEEAEIDADLKRELATAQHSDLSANRRFSLDMEHKNFMDRYPDPVFDDDDPPWLDDDPQLATLGETLSAGSKPLFTADEPLHIQDSLLTHTDSIQLQKDSISDQLRGD